MLAGANLHLLTGYVHYIAPWEDLTASPDPITTHTHYLPFVRVGFVFDVLVIGAIFICVDGFGALHRDLCTDTRGLMAKYLANWTTELYKPLILLYSSLSLFTYVYSGFLYIPCRLGLTEPRLDGMPLGPTLHILTFSDYCHCWKKKKLSSGDDLLIAHILFNHFVYIWSSFGRAYYEA